MSPLKIKDKIKTQNNRKLQILKYFTILFTLLCICVCALASMVSSEYHRVIIRRVTNQSSVLTHYEWDVGYWCINKSKPHPSFDTNIENIFSTWHKLVHLNYSMTQMRNPHSVVLVSSLKHNMLLPQSSGLELGNQPTQTRLRGNIRNVSLIPDL